MPALSGCEAERRQREPQSLGLAACRQRSAQTGVGGHAAGDGHLAQALTGGTVYGLVNQLLNDGRLVRSGDVGAVRLDLGGVPAAQIVEQGGLETAEAEVAAARHGAGEGGEARVALSGQQIELLAAGVAQPEKARALVEGLAGGVVHGARHDPVRHALINRGEQRVPAAGHETDERRFDPQGVVRGDVALDVVDRDERQATPIGDRLGRRQPHEQRTDETRAARGGDGAQVVPAHPSHAQGLGYHVAQQLGVAARRHLRHHATELGVQLVLRRDDGGEHFATAHHRGTGVVARGLEAEDGAAHAESPSQSFHMITASSRLSL